MARPSTYLLLSAASVDAVSTPWELTTYVNFTITARVNVSAATLQAALRFRGTNNLVIDPAEPILTNPVLITALPTGVTYSNGVITYNSPAIGINTVTLALPAAQLPQFLIADWDFTSGGGTVALTVQASGWGGG